MNTQRTERMALLLTDCFSAVLQAQEKTHHPLDGPEFQDLAATLYIQEQRLEEMDRRWPVQKDLRKIKAHLIPVDDNGKVIDLGPNEPNTQAASDYVAQKRIHELQKFADRAATPALPQRPPADDRRDESRGPQSKPSLDEQLADTMKLLKSCPWKDSQERERLFAEVRERIGEVVYLDRLRTCGVPHYALIRPKDKQVRFYRSLLILANQGYPHDDPPTGRAA